MANFFNSMNEPVILSDSPQGPLEFGNKPILKTATGGLSKNFHGVGIGPLTKILAVKI